MSAKQEFLKEFHADQVADLDRLALSQREAILSMSGMIVTSFLLDQAEKLENAERGDVIEFFVGQELGKAPETGRSVGKKALSFMVEGMNLGLNRRERLRIMLPVSPKLDIDNPRQIELIPKPKEVYTERSYFAQGAIQPIVYSRYIISEEGAMMYALDEEDLEGQKNQPGFEQLLYGRVTERLAMLGRIREDIINWDNKAQGRMVVGYKEVEGL